MPQEFSDKNTAPEVVRVIQDMSVANGTDAGFNIAYAIAGGLADASLNPRFILTGPSAWELDEVTGEVFAYGQDLPINTLHTLTIGVENDLGPAATMVVEVTSGTVGTGGPVVEAEPVLGAIYARPDGSDVRVSFEIDSTGVTSRQLRRRAPDATNGPDDNWTNLGSQATTDVEFLDTTAADGVAYEYSVLDVVGGESRATGTDVAWAVAAARTIIKTGDVITAIDGPFTLNFNAVTGALDASLNGVPWISSSYFSVVIHDTNGPNQTINPAPSTVLIDPVFAGSGVIGAHYEFAPDFQYWMDIVLTSGKPIVRVHQVPRWNRKDNPYNTYSNNEWENVFKVTNAKFSLQLASIADAPNYWQQHNAYEGVVKGSGEQVRPGIWDNKTPSTDLGTSSGGELFAIPSSNSTNGIASAYTAALRSGGNLQPHYYVEYIFDQPVNMDQLVIDYGEPIDAPNYFQRLEFMEFELTFSNGTTQTVLTTEKQIAGGAIGQLIGGPYVNLKKVRQTGLQTVYGQRTLYGQVRAVSGSETIAKAGINQWPDDVVNCAPYSFAVRDFYQNNPSEAYNDGSEVGVEIGYSVADQQDYRSDNPGCGPVMDCAVGWGTSTANHAFLMPSVQASQTAKLPFKIHNFLESGVSTTVDNIVARCILFMNNHNNVDGSIQNWSAWGDAPNGQVRLYESAANVSTQHQQVGATEAMLSLWQHTPTQERWRQLQAYMDFLGKATIADYSVRSHRLGAMCRKSESTPRHTYHSGEAQDGYRHNTVPFGVMADLTGLRYYEDMALRACDGASIVQSRDTDRNYYLGTWSREIACLYAGTLIGIERFGDVRPTFDGLAPTNTSPSPTDSAIPVGETRSDILNRAFDQAYADIAARVGSEPKTWGAGSGLDGGTEPLRGQPVWSTWSMAPLATYHDRLVAEGDTARAAKVYEVIEATANQFLTRYVQGTTYDDMIFAYQVRADATTGYITVLNWTSPRFDSASYGTFFAEFFAIAGEVLGNPVYTAKSLEIWNVFKDSYLTRTLNQRLVSGIVRGVATLQRIHGAAL